MSASTADLLAERAELRRLNLSPAPQRGAFAARSSRLKFDVKKATALAKRFKNYSAEASEKAILTQIETVSLGMFLSEAAHGVVQSLCQGTRMKPADAHSLAVVCSEVHQRYEEFWPSVQKELRENAEIIVDAGALKAAVERIEEYASATALTAGEGTAPPATSAAPSAPSAPPAATVKNPLPLSSGKSPVEEFNRLRLVARVFCEWWLVGLFADAKPVLNLLKLLKKLAERRAGTPNNSLAVATVLSITVLMVREVGIEMLGNENAALPCLFAGKGGR
ncbi:ARM repeat-containing protein [Trypanosoma conorhini]|uniref:ARM repeat-containing protein n=1 Tax=Trypanosoma conorhini TaxID=83891 RepID=A0A422PEW7_9TRYP|nr:ARM repeat-containing protein [Trypanosoma conorhini]RNF16258.1 ARM repeat-containing protein [Trypanosoma conorhini]